MDSRLHIAPYLPAPAWFREWALLRPDNPASCTGVVPSYMKRRDMARAMVAGARGQQPLLLSVPVEGGAGVIKRLPPEQWRVSMHGRWQAMHYGALEAAYGSSPYFRQFADDLFAIYEGVGDGARFGDLTASLLRLALDFLSAREVLESWWRLPASEKLRISQAARSMRLDVREDLSFFDTLFRYGPDAIFAILPLI